MILLPAQPFYLPVGTRRLFCIHHRPPVLARGSIVFVPAFAEEMNKSRRMAALQARALAKAGWHVLQLDLAGTGDSEGDFADATWSLWLEDVAAARAWLAGESHIEPWLWGLRLGALLAAASFLQQPAASSADVGLLMWQPVLSGRQHLQQFLRLKAGAEWLRSERGSPAQASSDEQLKSGLAVEVAGYTLAPGLAMPLAAAELRVPAVLSRIVWLEISPREGAALSSAAESWLDRARLKARVQASVVQGPSFWKAQEIEVAPALLAASCEALI